MRAKTFIIFLLILTGDAIAGTRYRQGEVKAITRETVIYKPNTYYISVSGKDVNSGLTPDEAWATLDKIATVSFLPGDFIRFKCGDIWRYYESLRIQIDGARMPLTFGSYGHGEKPCFTQSYNRSARSDWNTAGTNIWRSSSIAGDVGMIVFDGGATWGVKKDNISGVTSLGDFWYDSVNKTILLYALQNPGSIYSAIEIYIRAPQSYFFDINNRKNLVFENLAFKYNGAISIGGMNCDNIKIVNCDFTWVGGAYQSGTARYGNAVQFWNCSSNIVVQACRFDQIYDAAITLQGKDVVNKGFENCLFTHNIIANTDFPFEFWERGTNVFWKNIEVSDNIIIGTGRGFSHGQTNTLHGYGMRFAQSTAKVENFKVFNNIFFWTSGDSMALFVDPNFNGYASIIFDRNLYSQPIGDLIYYNQKHYQENNFELYQSETRQDMNSKIFNN